MHRSKPRFHTVAFYYALAAPAGGANFRCLGTDSCAFRQSILDSHHCVGPPGFHIGCQGAGFVAGSIINYLTETDQLYLTKTDFNGEGKPREQPRSLVRALLSRPDPTHLC